MVNCVLVMFHDMKARHLGKGAIECVGNVRRPFERKELVNGELVTAKKA